MTSPGGTLEPAWTVLYQPTRFHSQIFRTFLRAAPTLKLAMVAVQWSPRHPRFVTHSQSQSGADDFHSAYGQSQQQPNATSQCLHHSPLFISLHRSLIISQHHRKGEYRAIRCFEKERDRPHSQNSDCSILL